MPQPPSPNKVEIIGPYEEAYCFLYRYTDGGFFNFSFKKASNVTYSEWGDPDITIYKLARQHHAVIRHQKLDNKKGSLEIIEGPKIDVAEIAESASLNVAGEPTPIPPPPPPLPRCEGPCEPYELACPVGTDAACVNVQGSPTLVCLERFESSRGGHHRIGDQGESGKVGPVTQ